MVAWSIGVANSKRCASYADDPIFNIDRVDGPVLDTFYDYLDDGTSFDEELFVDPIIDTTPASDHATFTMLKFTNHDPNDLTDGPVFITNPDDLNGEPVFYSYIDDQLLFNAEVAHDHINMELNVFTQQPDDLVAAHTGVILRMTSLMRSPRLRMQSSSPTRPTSCPLRPPSIRPSHVQ
jgi:hypothetical protein